MSIKTPRRVVRLLDNEEQDIHLATYDARTNSCSPTDKVELPFDFTLLPLPDESTIEYTRIESFLRRLVKGNMDLETIVSCMKKYTTFDQCFDTFYAYCRSASTAWRRHFLDDILPFIADLALMLGTAELKEVPLLRASTNASVTMSQRQAAILLANSFFSTFDESARLGEYNKANMNALYDTSTNRALEKFKCIVSYFDTLLKCGIPPGTITLLRQACPSMHFDTEDAVLSDVYMDDDSTIETCDGEAHVDFANEYIGGGVLTHGLVQEEIRFLICPEAIVSCILCERMHPEEALLILGAQRFICHEGYNQSFHFVKRYRESPKPRAELGHYPSHIIAIDALRFGDESRNQFRVSNILRELKKAFIGFCVVVPSAVSTNTIATGNWGCGAFRGSYDLKFMIQWLAASLAGRALLHYHTFEQRTLSTRVLQLLAKVRREELSFQWLYTALTRYGEQPPPAYIRMPIYHVYTAPTLLSDLEASGEHEDERSVASGAKSPSHSMMSVDATTVGGARTAAADEDDQSADRRHKAEVEVDENAPTATTSRGRVLSSSRSVYESAPVPRSTFQSMPPPPSSLPPLSSGNLLTLSHRLAITRPTRDV